MYIYIYRERERAGEREERDCTVVMSIIGKLSDNTCRALIPKFIGS